MRSRRPAPDVPSCHRGGLCPRNATSSGQLPLCRGQRPGVTWRVRGARSRPPNGGQKPPSGSPLSLPQSLRGQVSSLRSSSPLLSQNSLRRFARTQLALLRSRLARDSAPSFWRRGACPPCPPCPSNATSWRAGPPSRRHRPSPCAHPRCLPGRPHREPCRGKPTPVCTRVCVVRVQGETLPRVSQQQEPGLNCLCWLSEGEKKGRGHLGYFGDGVK